MFYPASNSITSHVYYLLPSETLFVKVGLSGLSHWAVGRIKQNDFYEGVCCRISEASLSKLLQSLDKKMGPGRELLGDSFPQLSLVWPPPSWV